MSMTSEQMRTVKEFGELLCKQIDKINKKGDITPDELQRMDKAVDIIKDITVICAMEEYGKDPEEEMYSSMGYYGMAKIPKKRCIPPWVTTGVTPGICRHGLLRAEILWAAIPLQWDIPEMMEQSRQCGMIWN